jgi:GPH family glycoside/pentoside/hexuronide:cation symporter
MKFISKLGYGMGDLGAGCLWGAISFLMIYLTDSVGIGAAIVGTMMLVVRIFDGVSDAFVGTLIDNTHTKHGKARPWFLASILPLVVTTILLFNVPSGLSMTGKIIFVYILYFIVTVIFYTINNVAYNALPAFITDSTKDRISLNVYRYLFSLTIGIVVASFTMPLVERLGGAPNSQAGWTRALFIYSALALVALTFCGFSVKEKIDAGYIEKAKDKGNKLPFYKALLYTFENKYFIINLGLTLIGMTRIELLGAGVYYAQYNLGNVNLLWNTHCRVLAADDHRDFCKLNYDEENDYA